MSAHKIQTSGNYPEENIQLTEHSRSLKSRLLSGKVWGTNICIKIYNLIKDDRGKSEYKIHTDAMWYWML
jgi:hypothetical protein